MELKPPEDTILGALGIEIIEVSADRATATMPVLQQPINHMGCFTGEPLLFWQNHRKRCNLEFD